MDKIEFRKTCANLLMQYGFVHRKGAFYLEGDAEVICSIYLQASNYGEAGYLACCFTSKLLHPTLQYPTFYQTDTKTRITVLGKEPLANREGPYETTMIKYSSYNGDELSEAIDKAMREWILPAVEQGVSYILAHWDRYKPIYQSEYIFALLKQTQESK